jgi:hypothetical protein
MKKFAINYVYSVITDTVVEAENEKEARKKFKEVMPFEKIDSVWEVDRGAWEGINGVKVT